MQKIFVIEDDENIRNLVKIAMEGYGYQVAAFETAEEALEELDKEKPDLAVFDLMLPGMDGLSAIRLIRERSDNLKNIPIIVLTAKDKEYDKVVGLDGGADDYMTKPFAPEELLARLRALSRRQGDVVLEELSFGDLRLNLSAYTLSCGSRSVHLGYKEFEILRLLMSNPQMVMPKESILMKVWGTESDAEDNNVEAYMSFLRKKFHYLGSKVTIGTIRKVGYRLEAPGV